ncbi:homoserine kinase [Deinococcus xinjiangensis]|uniref:Homoserine kinase n=1 Tax=Deinococcus xinjiangensis TaxID=457454 RepID=A0ABP9VFU8_9DEIO
MSSPFPAVHSVLAAPALADLLRQEYALPAGLQVTLLRRNISDTYLVTLPDGERAILRVYRSGWRTRADVAWELALTRHVAARGVGAAQVLPRQNGELWGAVQAAEGERFYALFEYAAGRPLQTTPEDAALYGNLAAQFHASATDFAAGERFNLDLDHLITQPMQFLRPLMLDFPEQWATLEAAAQRTHATLSKLAPRLSWGVCHGDLHELNVRVAPDGLRLIDFDCGGMGYYAYDLAVYWWSQVTHSDKPPAESQAIWEAFLGAYQAARPLSQADHAALPHFVLARSLWFMGLMAGRAPEFGTETLGQPFFDFGANFVGEWMQKEVAD